VDRRQFGIASSESLTSPSKRPSRALQPARLAKVADLAEQVTTNARLADAGRDGQQSHDRISGIEFPTNTRCQMANPQNGLAATE